MSNGSLGDQRSGDGTSGAIVDGRGYNRARDNEEERTR